MDLLVVCYHNLLPSKERDKIPHHLNLHPYRIYHLPYFHLLLYHHLLMLYMKKLNLILVLGLLRLPLQLFLLRQLLLDNQ
jgi:hypothetical protein|tara:strand:- start:32 stop:271 length:240 start_codon:yes stop_codon:yes gene_type:complete